MHVICYNQIGRRLNVFREAEPRTEGYLVRREGRGAEDSFSLSFLLSWFSLVMLLLSFTVTALSLLVLVINLIDSNR